MNRRTIMTLLGVAAAWPLAARAQQGERMRRIGVFMPFAETDAVFQGWVASFRDGLAKLGWTEGRNLRIDSRWAGGDAGNNVSAHAEELVALAPDAIFTVNSTAVAALQRATHTVPIVFANVGDPIAAGFVSSLARPGGNITGFALWDRPMGAKRLELLKQIAPRVTRAVVIYDPASPLWTVFFAEIESAAPSLSVNVSAAPVGNVAEIKAAIDLLAREPNGGLIAISSPAIETHRDKIIAFTAQYHVPAVYSFRYYVAEGGLASYGVDNSALFREAASYINRILNGEKPGDLPVQFATKYELVINVKTARALGLEPSISLLGRTDEVIE
jgi:putative tryptophan/tyrosine transport system substrate-binding protein